MNFSFNVLGAAQSVIGKQQYIIEEWAERVNNSKGFEVDSYFAPQTRSAGVQNVDSKEIIRSGLKANSIYIKIYDVDVIGILSRSDNPPRISWNGYYWQPVSPKGDWIEQGGWNKVYCIRQGKL